MSRFVDLSELDQSGAEEIHRRIHRRKTKMVWTTRNTASINVFMMTLWKVN